MIEEILKSVKVSSGGRRWLTSEQKSLIVTEWKNLACLDQNLADSMALSWLSCIKGVRMI